MQGFNLKDVKLVIWDLDDTFWSGTVSEGDITFIEDNAELVKVLTDCGIVNSVCSKNDYETAKEKLTEAGMWEYFVCPSINWESKGYRVQSIISDLQLRDSNVLFIDDNPNNLNEVKYYNKNIMTASPSDLEQIIVSAHKLPKNDIGHSRLDRYKIIERKLLKRQESGSNLEFLMESNIKVEIRENCLDEVERLHELLLRTNQINYTKKRITLDELVSQINDKNNSCGYIYVKDDYGDYGIVGFYCLSDGELIHFAFSCRCLGMGVEQYVYAKLGYPKINVVGEVTVSLEMGVCPEWINTSAASNTKGVEVVYNDVKVLFKGPCDMFTLFSFINQSENIDNEFTYTSPTGVSIEQRNHTQCILQGLDIAQERIDEIVSELPFGDKDMYTQKMFEKEYDIVFFSTLTDCGLGVYKRKTGEYIAYGEYVHPLTDEREWQGYIDASISTSHCLFTREQLQHIKDNYEFVGRLSTDCILENIKAILKKLPQKTHLVLLLGSEIPYLKNKSANYVDRHLFYKELNDKIKEFAKDEPRISYIEFSRYVKSQKDFFKNINHFMKNIYYEIAQEMIEYMTKIANVKVKRKSKYVLLKVWVKQFIKSILGIKSLRRNKWRKKNL